MKEREARFLNLLATIATDLKYKFDKKDLERLSYTPQGWHNDEVVQRGNMLLLSQLLRGESFLRVKSESPQEHDRFPPPPE